MPYITYRNIEEEEIKFEITWGQLRKDEELKLQYAKEFADKYEIGALSAKKILDDYDMWFEDEEIRKEVFENNAEELFEKYYLEEE